MKTPREILLARHQPATPKLDTIRRAAVNGLPRTFVEKQKITNLMLAWILNSPKQLWRELVLPSRRVWAGLATAWLVILFVNFSLRDPAPTTGQEKIAAAPVMTWQQQEKLLAELTGPDAWQMAERTKTFSPRPRSEYIRILAT
ncbi:MAG TPA: hypothetical protein VGO57_18800 [Verrucomicrobiae bacterium]|jgi:hypothetical protein